MLIQSIPESWVETSIGEVYDVIGGGTPSTARREYWNGDIPWITSADIHGIKDIEISRYVSKQGIENSTTNKVPANTLLVVTRVGLGKIAIAERDICFSQDLQGLVQSSVYIWPKYSLYYLSYELQTLKFSGRGTTISGITKKQLKDTSLPLPPRKEQRRIVAKIEELFSELDNGIEALTTAHEKLKAYRHSVLKHAFERKLTEDFGQGKPSAWATLPVSQLLIEPLCNGRSVKDRTGGFPVLRLTAFKGGRIYLTESKEGDWNREDALPFLVSSGDFFVARGNGSKQLVGIGGLVSEVTKEVAFPDTMIRLRLNATRVDPRYFALCWNSRIVRQQIERDARTTAGIYKINQDHISRFTLPVPPLEEQRLIVSRVDEKLSEAESAIDQLSNDLQRGVALRQSILKQAFSGQLVAQDPEDEPASVLLKRIRAEREGTSTNKSRNSNNGKSRKKNAA
jgi:type I restriction enzyme S subunit